LGSEYKKGEEEKKEKNGAVRGFDFTKEIEKPNTLKTRKDGCAGVWKGSKEGGEKDTAFETGEAG